MAGGAVGTRGQKQRSLAVVGAIGLLRLVGTPGAWPAVLLRGWAHPVRGASQRRRHRLHHGRSSGSRGQCPGAAPEPDLAGRFWRAPGRAARTTLSALRSGASLCWWLLATTPARSAVLPRRLGTAAWSYPCSGRLVRNPHGLRSARGVRPAAPYPAPRHRSHL